MKMQLDSSGLSQVRWVVDKWICETPQVDNHPENGGADFISYSAYLTDQDDKPAKKRHMQLYSSINSQMLQNVIITTDPTDGSPPTILKPDGLFIDITSDKDGILRFRVYPMRNTPLVFEIACKEVSIHKYYSAGKVYIITPKSQGVNNSLNPPSVSDIIDNRLEATGSQQVFNASISNPEQHTSKDVIIFFTDNSESISSADNLGAISPAYDLSLGAESFSLYFDSFLPLGSESLLYYAIISDSGEAQYSPELSLVYGGGGDNKPSPDFVRPLDSPVVYNSHAQPLFGSSQSKHIIPFEGMVDIAAVSNCCNNGGVALNLKIILTDNLNITNKPLVNDDAFSIIYINSYNKIERSKFSFKIKSSVYLDPENKFLLIYGIPYKFISDIKPDPRTGNSGMIYFEYYTENQGVRTYSKYWEAKIAFSKIIHCN